MIFMTAEAIEQAKTSYGELPEVANRSEVSAHTRISIPTLARWAAEGKGPKFRRAGRRIIYLRTDVIAWLESLSDESA